MLVLSGALPGVQPSVVNLAFASIAAQACGAVCLTYAAVALPPRAAPDGYRLFDAPGASERAAAQDAAIDALSAAQRDTAPVPVAGAAGAAEPLLLPQSASASGASRSPHRDAQAGSFASASTQFGSVRGSVTGSEGTMFLSAQASLASISTVASGAMAPYSEAERTPAASPDAVKQGLAQALHHGARTRSDAGSVAEPLVRSAQLSARAIVSILARAR